MDLKHSKKKHHTCKEINTKKHVISVRWIQQNQRPVFICRSTITKYHKLSGLTHKNVSSRGSGGQVFHIKMVVGLVPSVGGERESVPCLSLAAGGFLAIFGFPWLVEASPWSLPHFTWCPSFEYACVQIFPLYKDTSYVGLEAHPMPAWLHLNQLQLQWPFFQIRADSELLGDRTSTWEFWETQFKL